MVFPAGPNRSDSSGSVRFRGAGGLSGDLMLARPLLCPWISEARSHGSARSYISGSARASVGAERVHERHVLIPDSFDLIKSDFNKRLNN